VLVCPARQAAEQVISACPVSPPLLYADFCDGEFRGQLVEADLSDPVTVTLVGGRLAAAKASLVIALLVPNSFFNL